MESMALETPTSSHAGTVEVCAWCHRGLGTILRYLTGPGECKYGLHIPGLN